MSSNLTLEEIKEIIIFSIFSKVSTGNLRESWALIKDSDRPT